MSVMLKRNCLARLTPLCRSISCSSGQCNESTPHSSSPVKQIKVFKKPVEEPKIEKTFLSLLRNSKFMQVSSL